MTWPTVEPIDSERLRLVPLAVDHAEQMVDVLADVSLYHYTGGEPPTLDQLRQRYTAQVIGHSPDWTQWWVNWVVTLRTCPDQPIGYVQATVEGRGSTREANIAWVISPAYQRRGIATEAAAAMVHWLRASGVDHFVAHIQSAHAASRGVARNLGLYPTDVVEDGEIRWQG